MFSRRTFKGHSFASPLLLRRSGHTGDLGPVPGGLGTRALFGHGHRECPPWCPSLGLTFVFRVVLHRVTWSIRVNGRSQDCRLGPQSRTQVSETSRVGKRLTCHTQHFLILTEVSNVLGVFRQPLDPENRDLERPQRLALSLVTTSEPRPPPR